jgi:hypothetical protein
MSDEIIKDEKISNELLLDEKIKGLEVDLLGDQFPVVMIPDRPVLVFERYPQEKNHTTSAIFEKSEDNAPVLPAGAEEKKQSNIEPAKEVKKSKKTLPPVEKIKIEKDKFTMAVIFSKDEHEKIMELYNARLDAGVSVDRNQFFRQIIQFACNAHKYKNPKFGMPEDFSIELKNTF